MAESKTTEVLSLIKLLQSIYPEGDVGDLMSMISSAMLAASKFKCAGKTKKDYVLAAMNVYTDTIQKTTTQTTMRQMLVYGDMFVDSIYHESRQKLNYNPQGCC